MNVRLQDKVAPAELGGNASKSAEWLEINLSLSGVQNPVQ